ncbi:unnamed protein product [Chrysoparadoxa australica]
MRVAVRLPMSVQMVEMILKSSPQPEVITVGVFTQRAQGEGGSNLSHYITDRDVALYDVGCSAQVVQIAKAPSSETFQYSLLIQGLRRIKLVTLQQDKPVLYGIVDNMHDIGSPSDPGVKALAVSVASSAQALLEVIKARRRPRVLHNRESLEAVAGASPPGVIADVLVSVLNVPSVRKQAILAEPNLEKRLRMVLELVQEQTHILALSNTIQMQVDGKLSSRHRDFYLKQQLKAIQEELGERDGDGDEHEAAELERKLSALELPEAVRNATDRDLRRLKGMQPSQPEYGVLRNYLEFVSDLPWGIMSEEKGRSSISAIQQELDEGHYGLKNVKQRIIEHIAVRALKGDNKGSIMCLVGPPGVGKTSICRAVAGALGRSFERLSLGGVHDESSIRGHRRTYIGAMPGNILQAFVRAKTSNPVLLLDEVDKLGTSSRGGGGPAAALLEVLDPEQNHSFTDHYLNLPFDLSAVFFMATANSLEGIPPPLLDRMELIELPGYTLDEKLHIAQQHLIPKQLNLNGVTADHVDLGEDAILELVQNYTREAGVRQLERVLASVYRSVALKLALHSEAQLEANESENEVFAQVPVGSDALASLLGPPRYHSERVGHEAVPGVSTGLAWTPSGGQLLFIECTVLQEGSGKITLTGSLGDVMKESAFIALTWMRGYIQELGGSFSSLEHSALDIHLHVPAGAIAKDGPSAGVAIACAMFSRMSGVSVSSDIAMTGEITLRGVVLPVGGIKEKLIAAHHAGIKQVIIPARNEADLEELPANVVKDLEVMPVKAMGEVFALAFPGLSLPHHFKQGVVSEPYRDGVLPQLPQAHNTGIVPLLSLL